jgi:signal transduction histidine kinase
MVSKPRTPGLGSACELERPIMSAASKLIELPVPEAGIGHHVLACELVAAVSGADSTRLGMSRLLDRVRREAGAAGVEWWGTGKDGVLTRILTCGTACGRRKTVSLGGAGALVIYSARVLPRLESALEEAAPVIRQRINAEQLADAVARLARQNEALAEFAALVAHELKTPLQSALATEDPAAPIADALALVDVLLEAARTDPGNGTATDVGECLDRALASLDTQMRITSELSIPLPVPTGPLFVVLRNLLSNAAAAGARNVRVRTERSFRSWRLLVEDDGSGLDSPGRYETGSGLGLSLCRQIAARSGGVLELAERRPSGSRATVTFGAPVR